MSVGQSLRLSGANEDGAIVGTWTIDKITVDYQCPGAFPGETPPKPEHGHFVKLDLRAATDTVGASNDEPANGINAFDFTYIGPDGLTFNGDLWSNAGASECIPQSQVFAHQLGRSQQFIGSVVLDVPAAGGSLIYYSNHFTRQPPGYEISIG